MTTEELTSRVNRITRWVFFGIVPVWGIWELALLWWRGHGVQVLTISMVAQRAGDCTALIWFWFGLGSHFWWNSPRWATAWGSIAFWVLGVLLLVEDIVLLNVVFEWPFWLQVQRDPRPIMVASILAGRFLFPQRKSG